MIRLLNGYEINYTEDFDKFFQNLLEAIIFESRQSSNTKKRMRVKQEVKGISSCRK